MKRTTLFRTLAVAMLAATSFALPAFAQDDPPAAPPPAPTAPTADEIVRVTEYFLRGKEAGPVLMELVACGKAPKRNADGKLACQEPLAGTQEKGKPLIAFVKFFVPKGGKYDDLSVKFLLDGEVRTTSDFTLSESFSGYSNYKQTTASKPGTWELQVLRSGEVLASKKVEVK